MLDIILFEPEFPGNYGAICRVMKNFGFYNLIVVNPKFDINSDEAKIRSKHAIDVLKKTKVVSNLKFLDNYSFLIGTSAIIGTDYNIKRSPIDLRDFNAFLQNEKEKMDLFNKKNKIAVLFGSEGSGLSNEVLEKCDYVITIDTDDRYRTLNLSHSVGICLYELSKIFMKEQNFEVSKKVEIALRKDKIRMTKVMDECIDMLYDVDSKKNVLKDITDKIFGKTIITRREVFGYLGFLKEIKKNILLKKKK